jgi:bifunctional oligoribonuclease and PAP phosphatase NrnA
LNYPSESKQIAELVLPARNILAISHSNPDADAVASLMAFKRAFESNECSITLVLGSGTVPESISFLPGIDQVTRLEDVDAAGCDLIIMVDCADEGRAGEIGERVIKQATGKTPIINIDHHVTNTRFGTVNLIDAEAAATCEILALLFEDLDLSFDADLATMLFTGIQGDTLGLRTPSTTGRTLEVSAALLRAGADLDTIVDYLFRIRPFSTLKLWGLALSRAEVTDTLVWTEVTPEMLEASGADESEGEGIVNFLAGTKGARAAALLYQKPDGWRVSLRSLADDVNVAELAALYGGGGHSRAAGCSFEGGTQARDEFLNTIAERIAKSPVSMQPGD